MGGVCVFFFTSLPQVSDPVLARVPSPHGREVHPACEARYEACAWLVRLGTPTVYGVEEVRDLSPLPYMRVRGSGSYWREAMPRIISGSKGGRILVRSDFLDAKVLEILDNRRADF